MSSAELLDLATFAVGVVLAGFLFGLGFIGAFEVLDALKSRGSR
jgi:hypothetical protein